MPPIQVDRPRARRSSRRCFTADEFIEMTEEDYSFIKADILSNELAKDPAAVFELAIFQTPIMVFGEEELRVQDLECDELVLYLQDAMEYFPALSSYLGFIRTACEVELENPFENIRCF